MAIYCGNQVWRKVAHGSDFFDNPSIEVWAIVKGKCADNGESWDVFFEWGNKENPWGLMTEKVRVKKKEE